MSVNRTFLTVITLVEQLLAETYVVYDCRVYYLNDVDLH